MLNRNQKEKEGPVQSTGPPENTNADFQPTASGVIDTHFRCETCFRAFSSKSGLGLHRRKAHEMEYNSSISVERAKKRWSEEELSLLASREAELQLAGTRCLNKALEETFPERTLEAIKGQRRNANYKNLVAEFAHHFSQTGASNTSTPDGQQTLPPDQPYLLSQATSRVPTSAAADGGVGSPDNPILSVFPDSVPDVLDVTSPHCPLSPVTCGSVESREEAPALRSEPLAPDHLKSALASLLLEKSGTSHREADLDSIIRRTVAGHDTIADLSDWYVSVFPKTSVRSSRKTVKQNNRDAVKQTNRKPPQPRRSAKSSRKKRKDNIRASKRQLKKQQFARVQQLFKTDTKRCANLVLADSLDTERKNPPVEEFSKYWGPVFTTPSPPCTADVVLRAPIFHLWDPFSVEEILRARPPLQSAAGPDGVSVRLMLATPPRIVLKLFDYFLFVGQLPQVLLKNRTIFIPKTDDSEDVSKFRPITVSSVFARWFHRALANRLRSSVDINERQKGFIAVDGCAENVLLLHEAIRSSFLNVKELHIATLDLAKAFDSVSHEAIILAARRVGLPPRFLAYLSHLYSNSTTEFQSSGKFSQPVPLTRGVRQGDPLSPYLFNYVMDIVLERLPKNIGYRVSKSAEPLNAAAFADDLNQMASTRGGLQKLLDVMSSSFAEMGLAVNVSKSHTISLVPSGREKKIKVVHDHAPFTIGGAPLPSLTVDDAWRYLGVQFQAHGIKPRRDIDISPGLSLLRKAPLKPYQRLYILVYHLLPRYTHELVLGRPSLGQLNKFDTLVRQAVRDWLRLPADCPNAYIHALLRDGGLGVPSMRWKVPSLIFQRFSKLKESRDAIVVELTKTSNFSKYLRKVEKMTYDRTVKLQTKEAINLRWATLLHSSVDGRGLRHSKNVPSSNAWIHFGGGNLSGNEYVEAIRLRINCLPTRARTGRGRNKSTVCRAGCHLPGGAPAKETLPHILQCCHRSHGARVKRHDWIVSRVAEWLDGKGHAVLKEGHYKLKSGVVRVPDLVVRSPDGDTVRCLDAQVISDHGNINAADAAKTAKYAKDDEFHELLRETVGVNTVSFGSITLTWRGLWCKASAKTLLDLGLTKAQLRYLSIGAIQGSLRCWRFFDRMTSVSQTPSAEIDARRVGVG